MTRLFLTVSHGHHAVPPVWLISFFGVLLICIAVLGLIKRTSHWWEHNTNKLLVSIVLGVPVIGYYLLVLDDFGSLEHAGIEYFSFLTLLGSLFTIAGGIRITANLVATPPVLVGFLGIGAILANFVGTTGAAMILIGPLLETIQERRQKSHIVIFFIFLVANIGGLLTALGDPPLFLGYLRGIAFGWTGEQMWAEWCLTVGILLGIFYIIDSRFYYRKESKDARLDDANHRIAPSAKGLHNIIFLGMVIGSIVYKLDTGIREGLMIIAALLSYFTTPWQIRKDNQFDFEPIKEVAVVFVGIFATMIPALQILQAYGSSMGVTEGWQYFWVTGSLSSFLDNAPTYLALGAVAQGQVGAAAFADLTTAAPDLLRAISVGAVFMGANTYIGNGPNFMIRAIARRQGALYVDMPEFFGYMKWSIRVLLPVFFFLTCVMFLEIPYMPVITTVVCTALFLIAAREYAENRRFERATTTGSTALAS